MLSLIPMPAVLEERQGSFCISNATVTASDTAGRAVHDSLYSLLSSATGHKFTTIDTSYIAREPSRIVVRVARGLAKNSEGYSLDVTPNELAITAATITGAFYALQTLKQLLPPQISYATPTPCAQLAIPCVHIEDEPRFSWRGLMLDCCRHYYPASFIKKFIDAMSVYKLNVFHWHLTDDQGWRIEIKKHPKLSEVAGWRNETIVGHQGSGERVFDGKKHGGVYTQAEVKDIVAYAAARHVMVVPEIEMPGHAMAALAAYPALSCTGGPFNVACDWGIHQDIFCAGNDAVFSFLGDILNEVVPLFPSQYFHIGGDECPKDKWKGCPKCQARMKDAGLKSENDLQSWFVRRMDKFLEARGKRLIGWDEILEGGAAPNATVMAWRGIKGGIEAARKGHDVVMSPNTHCYFDYYQSEQKESEPLAIGGCIPLEKVYSYEPVPDELDQFQTKHVLGVQGNVWTEYMPTSDQVEYMTYPRACALAEVAWSPKSRRWFDEFKARMADHAPWLEALKLNIRKQE